jgi:hypothetical protein
MSPPRKTLESRAVVSDWRLAALSLAKITARSPALSAITPRAAAITDRLGTPAPTLGTSASSQCCRSSKGLGSARLCSRRLRRKLWQTEKQNFRATPPSRRFICWIFTIGEASKLLAAIVGRMLDISASSSANVSASASIRIFKPQQNRTKSGPNFTVRRNDDAGVGKRAAPTGPGVYILNTPNCVRGCGACAEASNPIASTRRVSSGSIIPSSHKRAVE